MLKKIIYVIVAIVLGFVVFYISWRDSYSRAVVNRGNKALKEEDYEFFLKFFEIYEKDEIFTEQYTFDNNTTTIKTYNFYASQVIVDEKNKKNTEPRSGVVFLIKDINMEVVSIDESEPSDDVKDEDPATRMVLTADNGSTFTTVISTYGYDSAPVILYTLFSKELKQEFIDETHTTEPARITHIKMYDSNDVTFFDNNVNLPLDEHNEKEYWDNLLNEGKAGVSFTAKEYRNNFSFAFPEMNKTIAITAVTILILIGLGVFVFWPKKSFVPKEDEDRERYTFASTDEKEKYALAKVARGKKEKEDRENRYKNVRTEKSLDEITNDALEESIDKENTFEAAIEEDKKLEESNETSSTDEEIIETKKEEE